MAQQRKATLTVQQHAVPESEVWMGVVEMVSCAFDDFEKIMTTLQN